MSNSGSNIDAVENSGSNIDAVSNSGSNIDAVKNSGSNCKFDLPVLGPMMVVRSDVPNRVFSAAPTRLL